MKPSPWMQEPKRFTLDGEPVDLGELARVNDLDPEDLNAVGRLEVGQEFWFGGGAAPLFVLRRVS